jgi:hypothetical protein
MKSWTSTGSFATNPQFFPDLGWHIWTLPHHIPPTFGRVCSYLHQNLVGKRPTWKLTQEQCSRLKPSCEFQIWRVGSNLRRQSKNIKMKIKKFIFNLCMNYMVHVSSQCEELELNHRTPLLVLIVPYACWFLWRTDHIEDFKWRLHLQFGVAFWRLFWERYIFEGPNGVWRALKPSILSIAQESTIGGQVLLSPWMDEFNMDENTPKCRLSSFFVWLWTNQNVPVTSLSTRGGLVLGLFQTPYEWKWVVDPTWPRRVWDTCHYLSGKVASLC